MKDLLNSKWIFLVNTLPSIVLLIIAFGQYEIIESLLTKDSKLIWLNFGVALLTLTLGNVGYAVYCHCKNRNVSVVYLVSSLIYYTTFLYCYVQFDSNIIPFNIPRWMVSSEALYYPGTLIMPTLVYAIMALASISIPKNKKSGAGISFLLSLLFPLSGYLFFQIAMPLWQMPERSFGMHIMVILFIAGTIFFLFFICRGIYLIMLSKIKWATPYTLLWKIIITSIFPITGLLLNNGIFNHNFLGSSIFGDFSHPLFYMITIFNGLIICLPKFEDLNYRLLRLFSLILFLPFTLYFFFVFLPFLPLSVLAIIAVGIGFLMLSPLMLFILQAKEIYEEWIFFSKHYSIKMMLITALISFAVVPSIIVTVFLYDKSVLTTALNYVYNNNHRQQKTVNLKSLCNTLNTIRAQKGRYVGIGNLPFITDIYKWLVLDNLVLSDTKINILERIFLNAKTENFNSIPNEFHPAKIISINTTTRYDEKEQAWISNVELGIKNTDTGRIASYETILELPTGCWISDYYLYIGNKKEKGILAEKKSALWVFNQIRNENRDPGILYYLTGNRVAFKIFPFQKNELRKSGIEFIHKETTTINIDGQQIHLGKANDKLAKTAESANAVYIPAADKLKLPLVKRKPQYHFIVDLSAKTETSKRYYMASISKFIDAHKVNSRTAKIILSNYYSNPLDFNSNWRETMADTKAEGGFYLDAAVRQILREAATNPSNTYPVIVVLSNNFRTAIILKDFSDLKSALPEETNFYELDANHKIWQHSLLSSPLKRTKEIEKISTDATCYAWPNTIRPIAFLADDNQASIITNNNEKLKILTKFDAALNLQGLWLKYNLEPTTNKRANINLVRESFSNHILSPITSFIAVENDAQKMMLKKKQEQMLAGNKNLDTDEDVQSMAEPNFYLLLGIIILFLVLKKRNGLVSS